MGRIARLIWVDEFIWSQFQEIYPRQASKTVEDILRSMINLKLDISDEEGEALKEQRDDLQRKTDHLMSCLKEHNIKIQVWEAKKRKELLAQKEREKEEDEETDAILDSLRASGVLEEALK